ncbi:MAG: NAD-dependent succinate-semialdehyde dehydrogenase [Balneolaceae bacterium]|nr:NAD-dependent succinate-semialdehyde dehydrogenase [Balneolaceae bacterium]
MIYDNFGLLISGNWRKTESTITVESPVNGKLIGRLPAAEASDIEDALLASRAGFVEWSHMAAWDRARVLRKASELIRERSEEIAEAMTLETGKPLSESRAEVNASADQFEWYGEEAKRTYGQIVPSRFKDERLSVIYQPIGPCLTLSAWNFPALLPSRKIAAALAAGCSIIARPASEAAYSTFAIGKALLDAGLPPNAISILTGEAEPMVPKLIRSDIIKKVSLTGSVPVGRKILSQCAESIKKVTMELGGHAPVVIYSDVDPVLVAEKLASAKFRNCGQVCISPSRFYVHTDIINEFTNAFVEYTKQLKVGDGREEGITTGPMIRERSLQSALKLISDAKSSGAEILLGGNRYSDHPDGFFLSPTVLGNVPESAKIMQEEPFAPIAPITSFSDPDEAIERANSTPFGLASYVFTNDSYLANKTAMELEAGMVGVNETLLATAEAPFGGIKESGFGREGGSLGIMDYLNVKYVRHHFVRSN